MADFKLQVVFRPHSDMAQPSGVQIKDGVGASYVCRNSSFNSAEGALLARRLNVPFVLMSCAARRKAPQAASARPEPTRDAAHTKIGESGQCKMMIESRDEDVDWFWRDCIYDLRDLTRDQLRPARRDNRRRLQRTR